MPVPFTVRKLHSRLGATIYVTHDQVEAMTMSDKIVVLRNGSIEQTGAPLDLYDSRFASDTSMPPYFERHL